MIDVTEQAITDPSKAFSHIAFISYEFNRNAGMSAEFAIKSWPDGEAMEVEYQRRKEKSE